MNKFILYPDIKNMLTDTSLKCFFFPILTYVTQSDHNIHLFGTSLFSTHSTVKYSENGLFGFKYNDGIYNFLGDISSFEGYEDIPTVYGLLTDDFNNNKVNYYQEKMSLKSYLKHIRSKLDFTVADYEDYISEFYSYEFTKYHFQLTGSHEHISVLTERFHKNKDSILIDQDDIDGVLEEFFINMDYVLNNDYNFCPDMSCCAVELFRFMSLYNSGIVIGLFDKVNDIIYNLNYYT